MLRFARSLCTTLVYTAIFHVTPAFSQANVPHDQDYYTRDVRNTQLIYTEKDRDVAQRAAKLNLLLHPVYEEYFGYTLDEKLYVGLMSDYNQMPNGFTDAFPNARQMDYIGGALIPDYFSANSWLDTLIYHETAHSYQMNAKNNAVSRNLHSVFGNGFVILPWLTNPNLFESSFIFEGNAVLNESWHGNGGRLFSGGLKATALMQAKAGLLTPERVYNDHLYFDYGTHFYTLGAYYQYFLAQRYGLKKTNSYWLEHSKNWLWPFVTNRPTLKVFGKNFETLVGEWSDEMQREAENLVEARGKPVASTQFPAQVNDDKDEIYFIVNESGREYPDLVIYNKHDHSIRKETDSWLLGKVVKTPDGDYTTQSSYFTNPWRMYIGLYDSSAFILDDTKSQVVEGYLDDGRKVYFDIPSSWVRPRLFIGDEFIAETNSSVYIHGNDVYYFQLDGKQRTLYRNRKAVFSFPGYYGFVIGVNDKGIYFIGNTRYGSSLFRFQDGKFQRMNEADNIVDARLIDENTALVSAVGSDAYNYMVVDLRAKPEKPYDIRLFLEDRPYYEKANIDHEPSQSVPQTDTDDPYYSFLDMHYSGIDLNLGSDTNAGFIYNIAINFADPLRQNALSLFATRNLDEYTLAGASYLNTQYFLNYAFMGFHILDRPEPTPPGSIVEDQRENGGVATASIPFLLSGYYFGNITSSYLVDYQSNTRKPFSTALTLVNAKHFGASMDANFLLRGTAYMASERGDQAHGGLAKFQQGLPHEFFVSLNAQYSTSNASSSVNDHGIKINKTEFERLQDVDPTTIVMPSLRNNPSFVQKGSKYGGKIKKVFNFAKYYFTFPLSLRREKLYLGYNHYDFTDFSANDISANEITVGLTLDVLLLNMLPVPVSLEYIHNDNELIAEKDVFRIQAGFDF